MTALPGTGFWGAWADAHMWLLVVWFIFAAVLAWILGGSDQ
jgi:hypothetical protein